MRLDNWELDVISEHHKEWIERKFGEKGVRRVVGNMGGGHSPSQVGLLFLLTEVFFFFFGGIVGRCHGFHGLVGPMRQRISKTLYAISCPCSAERR